MAPITNHLAAATDAYQLDELNSSGRAVVVRCVTQRNKQHARKPARARRAPSATRMRRTRQRSPVKSPSNRALKRTDPLFHLYLICVGLITLSILAIKCLIPGMPIYTHTVIGFAFLLAIIVLSTIYTQVKSRKVSMVARRFIG